MVFLLPPLSLSCWRDLERCLIAPSVYDEIPDDTIFDSRFRHLRRAIAWLEITRLGDVHLDKLLQQYFPIHPPLLCLDMLMLI